MSSFFYRWFLLSAVWLPIAAPTGLGQTAVIPATNPPAIKFDVVSFKRCEEESYARNTDIPQDGDFIARHCQALGGLFLFAFADLGTFQLKNEPEWIDKEAYEFLAKVAPEDVPAWHQMPLVEKRLMARAVLVEYLHLQMHFETQARPVYALLVGKDGPKLTEHTPSPDDPPSGPTTLVHAEIHWVSPVETIDTNTSMGDLASSLSARLDHNVVDRTGLTGRYDFHVQPLPFPHYDPKTANVEDTNFAAIIDGVKSLGLRLEPAKADTSMIVIDHIDRPAMN
jgi:uncharacterized protein (TIGR03435 family)